MRIIAFRLKKARFHSKKTHRYLLSCVFVLSLSGIVSRSRDSPVRDAYSTAGFAGKQKVYTMYVTFISEQKHTNQKSGALGFHHNLVALVTYVVGVHVDYVSYVDPLRLCCP